MLFLLVIQYTYIRWKWNLFENNQIDGYSGFCTFLKLKKNTFKMTTFNLTKEFLYDLGCFCFNLIG